MTTVGLDPDAATRLVAAVRHAAQQLGATAANPLVAARTALVHLTAAHLRATASDLDRRIIVAVRADIVARGHHLQDPAGQAALRQLGGDPGRYPLAFDPTGDGTVVEVIGDLTTAGRVAVMVPGRGSSPAGLDAIRRDASALLQATGHPDRVAVVVWIGYDAPDGGWSLDAARMQPAISGAAALTQFVARLPRVPTTVIGHSYGAVVAATAAARHLPVDDLVLMGSPGAVVSHAGAYRLRRNARVWAVGAPTDPVDWIEWFGPNPTDVGFGAARVVTGSGGLHAHSSYLDDPTTLTNLGHIVAGRRTAVQVDEPTRSELVVGALDASADRAAQRIRTGGAPSVAAPFLDSVAALMGGAAEAVELGHRVMRAGWDVVAPDAPNPAGNRRGSGGSW